MESFKYSIPFMFIFLIYIIMIIIFNSRNFAASQSIVETLPGYPGTLPFKLETGYIGVGENEEVQLFYYFVESEADPERDPLVLWLTGGPGCSGFSGFVYEIGPLGFNLSAFDGSFPSFVLNPYSWTKVASIIFIDSPVGTGFSYANTSNGYASSDTKTAKHCYMFLQKWLQNHPSFIKNRLYIAGDSYGGKIAPMVAVEIVNGNDMGLQPQMTLQGYMVGNSRTDYKQDFNEIIPYAHRMALISDEYFELAKSSCNGDYASKDPNNYQCLYALQLVEECLKPINFAHILEPKCKFSTPKPWRDTLIQVEDDPSELILMSKQDESFCRNNNYVSSYIWANNETVQEALHIRKGIVEDWKRCNTTLLAFDSQEGHVFAYEADVASVLELHRLLNSRGYQTLAYSGDHDMAMTYMGTLKWIRALNLTMDEEWRPWTVDGQIAGYTIKYKNDQAFITFATIKGAGHTAPEYKPKECFEMLKRWLSSYPL